MAQSIRNCVQCGTSFLGRSNSILCSDVCRGRHRSAEKRRLAGRDLPRPCKACGRNFLATIGKGKHWYCPVCAVCALDGCARGRKRGAYCAMHGDRLARKGDPGPPEPLGPGPRPGLRPSIDQNGYERVMVGNGKYKTRHRIVMESLLGRFLHPFENVHHKNGRRADNRPENLELWTKPQPSGQRPEDLVSWVVYHYPELVEAELRTRRRERRSGQIRLIS